MPKVFVLAATMPTGGAYMAYHVGRLLHLHYGYEFVDVSTAKVERNFHYDIPMTTISYRDIEKLITARDVLVINPSYSHLFYGLRLPGRKIMYVQGVNRFNALDCQFDLYVSVSSLVQNYLKTMYELSTPVIPAFVDLDRLPETKPWKERTPGSSVIYLKHGDSQQQVLLVYLKQMLKEAAPQINLGRILPNEKIPHAEFLKRLGSVRYLVNLSLMEGFAQVPLEAMAMGTVVTGIDSMGGADYLHNGQNCFVGSARNLRAMPDIVRKAFEDEKQAAHYSESGRRTARTCGYSQFRDAWLMLLSQFLKASPLKAVH